MGSIHEHDGALPHRPTSVSPAPSTSAPDPIPDRSSSPEIPLTMSASVLLTALPRDASEALASAGGFSQEKVVVKFKPVGNAPLLNRDVGRINSTQKFEAVVAYLRRILRVKDTDSVFLYVNSAFAPSLDEIVGNLHRCFKNSNDQLVVSYSLTPAFG
jgi:ubiquitin-like protein ATG12